MNGGTFLSGGKFRLFNLNTKNRNKANEKSDNTPRVGD